MSKYFTTPLLALVLVFGGCAAPTIPRKPPTAANLNKLHGYFVAADTLERGPVRSTEWQKLGVTLHAQLRELGDASFAETLSKESYEVQVSVVNCMGFMDPSAYDAFPKTKHVLGSAPKW